MPVCARAVTQPDGSLLLALDPAVTDTATCAYVVETGSDTVWHELGGMSISDAQTISLGVGAVWAIAWAFKAVAKSISTKEGFENE